MRSFTAYKETEVRRSTLSSEITMDEITMDRPSQHPEFDIDFRFPQIDPEPAEDRLLLVGSSLS